MVHWHWHLVWKIALYSPRVIEREYGNYLKFIVITGVIQLKFEHSHQGKYFRVQIFSRIFEIYSANHLKINSIVISGSEHIFGNAKSHTYSVYVFWGWKHIFGMGRKCRDCMNSKRHLTDWETNRLFLIVPKIAWFCLPFQPKLWASQSWIFSHHPNNNLLFVFVCFLLSIFFIFLLFLHSIYIYQVLLQYNQRCLRF